eukprot:scaffold13034_cov85-Skeletonema_marinoi.AAC.1
MASSGHQRRCSDVDTTNKCLCRAVNSQSNASSQFVFKTAIGQIPGTTQKLLGSHYCHRHPGVHQCALAHQHLFVRHGCSMIPKRMKKQ